MQQYSSAVLEAMAKPYLLEAQAEAEETYVGTLAQKGESTRDIEHITWLGEAPIMQALTSELVSVGLSDADYTVENQTYAVSIKVPRNLMADDQIGGVMQRVKQMGSVAANFANRLIIDALVNGTTLTGYDGAAFFSDTHPARGQQTAAQDNLLAGTGVTTAQVQTDITSAIAAIGRFQAENGEPHETGRTRFALVHPYAVFGAVNEAVNSNLVANTGRMDGAQHVRFGNKVIQPVCAPRLTDANDWYLLDISPGAAPLLYQEREGIEFEVLGPGSDFYVKEEAYLFKVRWRGALGYLHWARAAKVVNT